MNILIREESYDYKNPTGIQESYRYAGILQVYRNPTGIQESYRYPGILQEYKSCRYTRIL